MALCSLLEWVQGGEAWHAWRMCAGAQATPVQQLISISMVSLATRISGGMLSLMSLVKVAAHGTMHVAWLGQPNAMHATMCHAWTKHGQYA
jgi:hypothetical protein